ncbi:unnamed protein product [Rotaria sp. Silwood2]|nr:unnamed protein product [Rotaria sp. Silwood2]CAF4287098.1 unnamed protein product [Rotaria sp. Silwood2]
MHAAASYGRVDVVRCLLENGTNFRIENKAYNTAEDEAYNDDVRKNTLTQHQTLLHCANLVDFNENTSLHLAAYGGHTSIVDYLVNHGCDPTVKNLWGTTAEEEGNKYSNSITDIFKRMCERDMFETARTGQFLTPDPKTLDIPECICLFQAELNSSTTSLVELPVVSMIDKPNALLYTFVQSSLFWFNSSTRRSLLPIISGIYAFVLHFDIIPNHLTLPADMFIAATLERPLISRDKPVPCRYLVLRKNDSNMFPHIAYHGTTISAIQSILHDRLAIPGMVTTSGKRINPLKYHIARDKIVFGISDFASVIFLSSNVHYSSDLTYEKSFSHGDKLLAPVIEDG